MSEDIVPFKCPSCGGEQLRAAQEIRSYQDFIGAVCVGCEHTVSDADIKNHAIALARQLVGDTFKDLKL